jgi:hypothetical protein
MATSCGQILTCSFWRLNIFGNLITPFQLIFRCKDALDVWALSRNVEVLICWNAQSCTSQIGSRTSSICTSSSVHQSSRTCLRSVWKSRLSFVPMKSNTRLVIVVFNIYLRFSHADRGPFVAKKVAFLLSSLTESKLLTLKWSYGISRNISSSM